VGLGVALAAGCADLDTGFDPAFGLPDVAVDDPSFAQDVQPIFERRCATGGCHTLASAQAGLVLEAQHAYGALVNQPSTLNPPMDRVEPFDPDGSWLVRMIRDEPAARNDLSRMPLAAAPLTENQIRTIVNWILAGAPDN
jgi:hypothetical protein